jgi:hypothetical protein
MTKTSRATRPSRIVSLALGALAACGDGTAKYCVQPHFTFPKGSASTVIHLTLTRPGDPSPLAASFQDLVPNDVVLEVCGTKLNDGVETGWTATAWAEALPTDGGPGACERSAFSCAPQPGEPSATQVVALDPNQALVLEMTLK